MDELEGIQSSLAREYWQKLNSLKSERVIKLLYETYEPDKFGGAVAFRISVDKLLLEVSTRDPSEPFEIELNSADFKVWARASYIRSFLLNLNDPTQAEPFPELIDWLVDNFVNVYALICDPASSEKLAEFQAFAKMLDELIDAKMIDRFKRQRETRR